jgi:phosphatidylglycerol---prolipoprotein diacylglyceryl transferase
MPTLYTTIGPWTFPTFNLVLTLAVLVSAGIGLRRAARPGMVADVYLGALIGAMVGARLFHVLLNWDYFGENLHEAAIISLGGLDWHGAVLGGMVGLYGVWRLRRWIDRRRGLSATNPYRYTDLLDSLTPALPLIGLAGWWGCLAASCGYGAEVDNLSNYPPFVAAETADVFGIAAPRYNTQLFGVILSFAVLVLVGILFWRNVLRYRRFWLILALLSLGMFVIGFYRGDHATMVAGLRADQVLDVIMMAVSIGAISRQPSAISKRKGKA